MTTDSSQPRQNDSHGTGKRPKKPPLTEAQRHERFIAMVGEVGASTDASDFNAVFKALDKRQK